MAYHDNTWTKWALIPFWITHITFLLALIGADAYYLMDVDGSTGHVPTLQAAFLVLFCIALIIEPLEMVFQSYRILEPWLYLTFQVYESFVTTIFLALAADAFVKGRNDALGLWAILIIAASVLSFYGSLIYGSVVFHRHRKENARYNFVEEKDRPISEGSREALAP